LCRDESPVRIVVLEKIVEAMQDGRLPEKEVDEKLKRILRMRLNAGLFDTSVGLPDPSAAQAVISDPDIRATAVEAAEKSVTLVRDSQKALPVSPDKKVLLIEQVFVTQQASNNGYSRPGLLWEELSRHSANVRSVEINDLPTEEDLVRVRRRLKMEEYDLIVITNYFHYKIAGAVSGLVDECMTFNKPVIVVANNPYTFSVKDTFDTVLVCYNPGSRENMDAVARIVYGKLTPVGTPPSRT
jgi:hypothetical protein